MNYSSYYIAEFNEDDPLAGLLSDDEDDDSWATKPAAKRSSLKKKEEPVVKKQEPEPVKVVEGIIVFLMIMYLIYSLVNTTFVDDES